MFEDIIPPQNDDKKVEHKSKTQFRANLIPKKIKEQPSLTEQIKSMTDLRQLVKILEIAKVKVRKEKIKQRKLRKKNRQDKY